MKKTLLTGLILIMAVTAYALAGDMLTISLVNQDPTPALAGNLVEIRLGVENTAGQPSEDVVLEFQEEYPFKMVPGENPVKKVGTLDSYQSGDNYKIIKYKIQVDKDAPAGEYQLSFWQYKEGEKEIGRIKKTISIDIKSKEGAEVIYIDKTDLVPGKQTNMKFVINNVGSAPLRDLVFSWENEDGTILPVGSDNTKYIKYIDVGESAELDYKVIADSDAEPGLYKLSLSLKYDDPITGEANEISTVAGVYVGGETDFDVAFSESTAGETSFSIANIGSNPAFSVSVIIPQQQGWRTTGSNSVIIGNLNKGDYTVASFNLQSGGMQNMTGPRPDMTMSQEDLQKLREQRTSQQRNAVTVQIAYTDTMGERRILEKEVPMNPTAINGNMTGFPRTRFQQESTLSKYKWYIIGIVALVILYVLYSRYKQKKLENPKFKLTSLFKSKK